MNKKMPVVKTGIFHIYSLVALAYEKVENIDFWGNLMILYHIKYLKAADILRLNEYYFYGVRLSYICKDLKKTDKS